MAEKRQKWGRPTDKLNKGDLKPERLSENFELEPDIEPEPDFELELEY